MDTRAQGLHQNIVLLPRWVFISSINGFNGISPLQWSSASSELAQVHMIGSALSWSWMLCVHVGVLLLSSSNTWLHCQGVTHRGQCTTVFTQSSYCWRSVDSCYFLYSPPPTPPGSWHLVAGYLLFSEFNPQKKLREKKKLSSRTASNPVQHFLNRFFH